MEVITNENISWFSPFTVRDKETNEINIVKVIDVYTYRCTNNSCNQFYCKHVEAVDEFVQDEMDKHVEKQFKSLVKK